MPSLGLLYNKKNRNCAWIKKYICNICGNKLTKVICIASVLNITALAVIWANIPNVKDFSIFDVHLGINCK